MFFVLKVVDRVRARPDRVDRHFVQGGICKACSGFASRVGIEAFWVSVILQVGGTVMYHHHPSPHHVLVTDVKLAASFLFEHVVGRSSYLLCHM